MPNLSDFPFLLRGGVRLSGGRGCVPPWGRKAGSFSSRIQADDLILCRNVSTQACHAWRSHVQRRLGCQKPPRRTLRSRAPSGLRSGSAFCCARRLAAPTSSRASYAAQTRRRYKWCSPRLYMARLAACTLGGPPPWSSRYFSRLPCHPGPSFRRQRRCRSPLLQGIPL